MVKWEYMRTALMVVVLGLAANAVSLGDGAVTFIAVILGFKFLKYKIDENYDRALYNAILEQAKKAGVSPQQYVLGLASPAIIR